MNAKQIELLLRYGIEAPFPADETYAPGKLEDFFPEKTAWVVRDEGGTRTLDGMRWGFPHQVQGARGKMISKSVTNVRNLTSPFWRSALKNPDRRCLVPFTTFSEYGTARGMDGRLPLHWFNVPSREIVSFAGVWRPAEEGSVFAFLTCEPNQLVASVHPKAMPVILREEDEARWLGAEWTEAATLATPYPAELMADLGPEKPPVPSRPTTIPGELPLWDSP